MVVPSESTYRLPSFDASAFLCDPFGTLLRYWRPLLCFSHQIAPPTGHNNLVGLNTWCSPAVLPVVRTFALRLIIRVVLVLYLQYSH
jgi:hypothetical protein